MNQMPQGLRQHGISLLLGLGVVLAAWGNLATYLRPGLGMMLGLLAAPFVVWVKAPGVYTYRYALVAAAALGAFWYLHMQVLYLIAAGATLILIAESRIGQVGFRPLLLTILLSPVWEQFNRVLTFPLRLKITDISTRCLQLAGMPVAAEGNAISVKGTYFFVDDACAGLDSLLTGIFVTVLLLAWQEKEQQRSLPVWIQGGVLGVAAILLLGSNIFRVMALVVLKFPQDTVGHELIGLLCLLVYAIAPIWLLVWWLTRRIGRPVMPRLLPPASPHRISGVLPVILSGALLYVSLFQGDFRQLFVAPALHPPVCASFEVDVVDLGIIRLRQDSHLVYIKPPITFWQADHHPTICWRGSGYEFTRLEALTLAGLPVMTARITRDSTHLYTAWWFENGLHHTTSQLDLRWRQLGGEPPFRLLNLTARSEEDLHQFVTAWLQAPRQADGFPECDALRLSPAPESGNGLPVPAP
ncbi:MAG: exosortase N [Bacteroidia bacterium]|nr:exosortase N [Bacteroidia bacterium]